MQNDPEDFKELVARLPAQHEIDLMNSEALSTAFYACRRKGWTTEQLVGDAMYTIGRQGVGGVITRFRGLSQHVPVERRTTPTKHYHPEPFIERLPSEWVEERSALLQRIAAERPGEETAHRWMRDLIARQRSGEAPE